MVIPVYPNGVPAELGNARSVLKRMKEAYNSLGQREKLDDQTSDNLLGLHAQWLDMSKNEPLNAGITDARAQQVGGTRFGSRFEAVRRPAGMGVWRDLARSTDGDVAERELQDLRSAAFEQHKFVNPEVPHGLTGATPLVELASRLSTVKFVALQSENQAVKLSRRLRLERRQLHVENVSLLTSAILLLAVIEDFERRYALFEPAYSLAVFTVVQ